MLSCNAALRPFRRRRPPAHPRERGGPALVAVAVRRLHQQIREATERFVGRWRLVERGEHDPPEREQREETRELVGAQRRVDGTERDTLVVRDLHGLEVGLEAAAQDARDMRIATRDHDHVEQQARPSVGRRRETVAHDPRRLAPRPRDHADDRVDDLLGRGQADGREEQIELAGEVRVQRSGRDAGALGDAGDRRGLVALRRELLERRVDERGARVRPRALARPRRAAKQIEVGARFRHFDVAHRSQRTGGAHLG